MKPDRPTIDQYPYRSTITTRWNDNDVYGHINNVAYYAFFALFPLIVLLIIYLVRRF